MREALLIDIILYNMIKSAIIFIVAGIATVVQTLDFLHSSFPLTDDHSNDKFDVVYNFIAGNGGPFFIGSANNTLNLRPKLNMDYTIIAAPNCTECPSKNYDVQKSE
jgi:hypothetical protein